MKARRFYLKIWYLDHSGFAVKTPNHFLIFDYYTEQPKDGGLEQGVINPEDLKDENVLVFSSHHHPDHLNRNIFQWKNTIPNIRYILSSDIRTKEEAIFIRPREIHQLEDITIQTLKSTDEGVAFIVEVDGLRIYHAGDLNWWHWDLDSEEDNKLMAKQYQEEIDRIKGQHFHLAFVPVDSRQGKDAILGIDYLMKQVEADHIVPMHFWGKYEIFQQLQDEPCTQEYRHKIWNFQQRGDMLEIE